MVQEIQEDLLLQDTKKQFLEILHKKNPLFLEKESTSPLYQICSLVAQKKKLPLSEKIKQETSIEAICQTSSIGFRYVFLTNHWQTKDHGHLVGFLKETNEPVALISHRNRYEMIDINGKSEWVTIKNTALFSPIAVALYETLDRKDANIAGAFKKVTKNNTKDIFLVAVCSVLTVFVSFFFPIANKLLFDSVIPNFNYTLFWQIILGLFCATISSTLFSFVRSITLVRFTAILSERFQLGLFSHLLKLSNQFIRRFEKGDLLIRTSLFTRLQESFSQATLSLFFNGFFGCLYFALMLYFSWQLALITSALIFLYSIFSFCLNLYQLRFQTEQLEIESKIKSFLLQMIQGLAKIKILAYENRILQKWVGFFSKSQHKGLKIRNIQNFLSTTSSFFSLFLTFIIFGMIIYLKKEDISFTPGTFFAFLAIFAPFSSAIFGIFSTFSSIISWIPFWKRVKPLLEQEKEDAMDKQTPEMKLGALYIENVSFQYAPHLPKILDSVSLKIEPGQFVGIVGKSGCGKSTLSKLLVGFESLTSGDVYFDNQNIKQLNLNQLREKIGICLQDTKIFSASIFDNITCGLPTTQKDLEKALEYSTLNEELKKLPMGLDTLVSQFGNVISGGQKQKILLARAFIKKPQILLLDETLNSLDNATKGKVLKHIRTLGITTILITHHINSLKKTDLIYVLKEGKVDQSGTFKDLSYQDGQFKQFIQKQ
ncbi:MAG: Alpha-hemolysin translocation ATP-binding protein HlyB [Chlamydiae bacterium]|nr:Alpha-hemolysin translocation ATP-binding protein HlyB [Chlamydiota bacterium]